MRISTSEALYNHILSTQHPEHGGYVYFTSARPAHYRVYSAPNSAMWCCVGTGMENHGKYGEFIYHHRSDSLYVNLFIPSQVNWADKKLKVTQQTNFPDEESSRLIVNVKKPTRMKLLVRKPWWCKDMRAVVDGKDYAASNFVPQAGSYDQSGYIVIDRKWKDGDVVDLSMPMAVTVEEPP